MTKQEVARPFWLGLTAGAALSVAAVAMVFASSETVLRSSFQTAINNRVGLPTREVASVTPPISGSEDFWLSAMRDGTEPVNKTVSVGDRISLTLGGVHRTFEVTTVSDFAPQITQIDTSPGPSHLVLVTAHDVKDPSARPIRFVMEIEQGNAPVVAGGHNGRTL